MSKLQIDEVVPGGCVTYYENGLYLSLGEFDYLFLAFRFADQRSCWRRQHSASTLKKGEIVVFSPEDPESQL